LKELNLVHELAERNKELECLYELASLVEKPGISLDGILQGIPCLLSKAYQYPSITCSRIILEDIEFQTDNFKESPWKQYADMTLDGKKIGELEVFYLEEKPLLDEGPFLNEERRLIDAVAERITRIFERKKNEDALANSEARYRALVENADDAILLTDLKGNSIYRNPAYFKNLGIKEGASEAFAKMHPDDLSVVKEGMSKLLRTGYSAVEYRVKDLCGSWRYRFSRSTLIFNSKHEPSAILSVIRDITIQKIAEQELIESEQKYETTFESSMDALMLLDTKSFFDCNSATLTIFRCKTVNEFIENHPSDLSPPSQPDGTPSLQAAMNHINRALVEGTDHFFWIHRRMDGTTFPADVLLTKLKIKGQDVLQATVRDVTQQKESEEKLKESSRRIEIMNEKLRVVGSLTRHDVRNKLSVIPGYSYLIKKKHPDQADVVEGLSKMEQTVKEVEKVFEFAKAYEQLGVENLVVIDVEKAVDEAAGMFSDLKFNVVNNCSGLSVMADSFIRQLIYNLIDNTRKYGKKTKITKVHYEKTDEDNLNLIYEDDGEGIPLENKQYLFEKGFSTGGSTGFGLFLSKKMIEVYGWTIKEMGEPGKGAKFVITIPRINKDGKENYQA
jgi:PAS domain S-box-containing protein